MAETLLFTLAALYAVVAVKVDQWYTISSLGFKSETPELFLSHPKFYHWTRIFLFAATVAVWFFTRPIQWYVGVVGLSGIWLCAFWIGRNLGFADFRRVHREIIEDDKNLKISDPAEYARKAAVEDPALRLAELERGARTTNGELIERIQRLHKLGL
jgi:hypothetical protein